jgi:hypothetical protein
LARGADAGGGEGKESLFEIGSWARSECGFEANADVDDGMKVWSVFLAFIPPPIEEDPLTKASLLRGPVDADEFGRRQVT